MKDYSKFLTYVDIHFNKKFKDKYFLGFNTSTGFNNNFQMQIRNTNKKIYLYIRNVKTYKTSEKWINNFLNDIMYGFREAILDNRIKGLKLVQGNKNFTFIIDKKIIKLLTVRFSNDNKISKSISKSGQYQTLVLNIATLDKFYKNQYINSNMWKSLKPINFIGAGENKNTVIYSEQSYGTIPYMSICAHGRTYNYYQEGRDWFNESFIDFDNKTSFTILRSDTGEVVKINPSKFRFVCCCKKNGYTVLGEDELIEVLDSYKNFIVDKS